ncbi:DUF1552 domain-containing protein [Calycomorphotria hydatis]|uniref:DUF1552 domain-containing protein n=1 Tax=Calycomorphotria hydatis TaxID=2528027 RepID=A0A517TE66_9PLAN|nr:DUF1552 domain-containing protein [Calycomorphotria hydatis]QDT66669.1 hypothetical protein V22_39400 [Calycomorphotria hydatis]
MPRFTPISRRTVLRSASAAVALPFLESMVPTTLGGTAPGATSPLRSIFIGVEGGIWTGKGGFFPYKTDSDLDRAKEWGTKGVLPGGFIADTGKDYQLSPALEPLADYKDRVLLLSGLKHAHDLIPNSSVNAHGQDLGTLLTGVDISGTPGVSLRNGQSIDQFMAERIGRRTRYSSLQLAVGKSSYNTQEASRQGLMGFLSYDAEGNALPVEANPEEVFDRLFTEGTEESRAKREQDRNRRASILDSVLGDLNRLNNRVSKSDRRKLDEYSNTVREIERRIDKQREWEDIPIDLPADATRPSGYKGYADREGDGSGRVDQMQMMLDMLALSMQTDVTRIATLRMGGYYGTFKFLGFPDNPHNGYAHGASKDPAGAQAIDRLHVSQLAYLLKRLDSMSEGDGSTVLDNSMVFYGAGLTNGPSPTRRHDKKVGFNAHGQVNTPVLVAGGAGGRLQTGRHVTYDNGTPLSNLFVTMMEAMDITDQQFSDSTGSLTGIG